MEELKSFGESLNTFKRAVLGACADHTEAIVVIFDEIRSSCCKDLLKENYRLAELLVKELNELTGSTKALKICETVENATLVDDALKKIVMKSVESTTAKTFKKAFRRLFQNKDLVYIF